MALLTSQLVFSQADTYFEKVKVLVLSEIDLIWPVNCVLLYLTKSLGWKDEWALVNLDTDTSVTN